MEGSWRPVKGEVERQRSRVRAEIVRPFCVIGRWAIGIKVRGLEEIA